MPLNYSIAMLKNPQKQDEEPKAYAKSQITGELTLKELGQQVASQTTVDISGSSNSGGKPDGGGGTDGDGGIEDDPLG